MWEIATLVEVLERKGLCTKQDISTTSLPSSERHAPGPVSLRHYFPPPYLLSQTEEQVIDDILAVLNTHGMDRKQSLELLEQVGRIIEMGAKMIRGTTH